MANSVLHRYWPVHEAALVARDVSALRRLETGPMADFEPNAVACGCLTVSVPRPLLAQQLFVPLQASYPAHFAAEVLTEEGDQPFADIMVFTKTAAGQPWLVSEDSAMLPAAVGATPALLKPSLDAAGYVQSPTVGEQRRARSAAAQLAALWQTAKDDGLVPPSGTFQETGQTLRRLTRLAEHRQNSVQANGLLGHFQYSVARGDPLVVFRAGAVALACQAIRGRVTFTAEPGEVVHQDPAQRNWGPTLAPGGYPKVVTAETWNTCFVVPSGSGQKLTALDHDIAGDVTTPGY